jgi:hypothetical protein
MSNRYVAAGCLCAGIAGVLLSALPMAHASPPPSAPSTPANLNKSPTGTGGLYTLAWDASTGTVDHYTLQEIHAQPVAPTVTYPVAGNKTFKTFNKGSVYLELQYHVRGCATSDESVCSGYSNIAYVFVCPTSGCP